LIDEVLARLARDYPNTKFLRTRATALGFATTKTARTIPTPKTNNLRAKRRMDSDEDDEYNSEEDQLVDDDDVDLDMLPTMLVYRAGELVFNWVRVDWEAGKPGLEELLDR
jgi:hypothetical protein